RVRWSAARGRDWVLGMQNPDGGWPGFVYGHPSKPPGPLVPRKLGASLADVVGLVLDPPPDFADPSTEDVTARGLHGLVLIAPTTEVPGVAGAVAFLRAQQCASGAWWGKWMPTYLPTTAFVLLGLESVGVDMQAPWVRRAVRWVLDRQNADGGWGEGPDSY